ncbi:UDP binding domain-containing protein [Mesorhizobium sp. ANAO-SY3R2]|uniref:UDP binding domain-containing protein n=1 Tax=Mesorhizobium sp. ANAO-SY3R2 TaxID=3166644 RepID=UPI00366AB293
MKVAIAGSVVLGLAPKRNADDMGEAPAVSIISFIQASGASVSAYDPEGMRHPSAIPDSVAFTADAYERVKDVDRMALVTEWDEFSQLDFRKAASLVAQKVFADLPNAIEPSRLAPAGFSVHGTGNAPWSTMPGLFAVRPYPGPTKRVASSRFGIKTVRKTATETTQGFVKGC